MTSRASAGQQITKPPAKRKRKSSEKNWIEGAIKRPGALRADLDIPKGQKIPKKVLKKATKSGDPTIRKRAILATTLGKLRKKKGRS